MGVVSRSCQAVEKGDGDSNLRFVEEELPPPGPGELQVAIRWSAINYKDALCATGNPGVARKLPIVPGIDAGGTVRVSGDPRFPAGSEVFLADARFGTEVNGGWATIVNVPADWAYHVPSGMSLRESVILGTAGFTAAQSLQEILDAGIAPESGPLVVTGATGGVGSFALAMLANLGYEVVAVSGKPERHEWLRSLGARETVSRESVLDSTNRPLLSARWAGAVDTVGGSTLASILRATRPGGCVTACGLVGGAELELTVFPFILRGVRLQGIDSAGVSRDRRETLWAKMAGEWSLSGLELFAQPVSLSAVGKAVRAVLAGGATGRTIVDPTA